MTALSPDCLRALEEAYAEKESYRKVGDQIGYSPAAVCQLLKGKYAAKNVSRVEAAIRARLLSETVECPALGEIPMRACLEWQAKPFAATNHQRVQMYQACQACDRRKGD